MMVMVVGMVVVVVLVLEARLHCLDQLVSFCCEFFVYIAVIVS
jgi:hypothetical protein